MPAGIFGEKIYELYGKKGYSVKYGNGSYKRIREKIEINLKSLNI
jgi:hypothetical protein